MRNDQIRVPVKYQTSEIEKDKTNHARGPRDLGLPEGLCLGQDAGVFEDRRHSLM